MLRGLPGAERATLPLVSAGDPYPASWHRAIAARVRERLEGVTLTYAPES